jgi:protein-tyrosine phosphatase
VRVLFVCTGNACRSPLADALLKMLRPDVDTDSAGTYAYHKVIDLTRRYAEKEGADRFLKRLPESLESKNLCDYDLIIAMEPKHEQAILRQSPECADKIEVWFINDPYNQPYKQAQQTFDKIKSKVSLLAKTL